MFEGVDVRALLPPAANRTVIATDIPVGERWGLAMVGFRYVFYGQSAHAAIAPHQGINALNSVIQLFNGIDALRQHLREDVRIHGIISSGGKAPNVVLDYPSPTLCCARATDLPARGGREGWPSGRGAALITGARLEIERSTCSTRKCSPTRALSRSSTPAAARSGWMSRRLPRRAGASTDLWQRRQIVPTFSLSYATSPVPVVFHTPAMTEVPKSDLAQDRTITAAKIIRAGRRRSLEQPAASWRSPSRFRSTFQSMRKTNHRQLTGSTLPNRGVLFGVETIGELLALGEQAEETGLFQRPLARRQPIRQAPPRVDVLAVGAGRATSKVRLAVGCMASFPVRHPALLAAQWASLDLVASPGRALLAVCIGGRYGGGDWEMENEVFGVEQKSRVSRMEEGIQVVRKLFTEEEVTHEGKYYKLNKARLEPRPVTKPAPAIWIAANPRLINGDAIHDRALDPAAPPSWPTAG